MRGDINTNANKHELKEILFKISEQFELIINNDETSNIFTKQYEKIGLMKLKTTH